MEILINDQARSRPQCVLMFGLGMIGSAIRDALERSQFVPMETVALNWDQPEYAAQVCDRIAHICRSIAPTPGRISVVWSAGAANFFSSAEAVNDENEYYGALLELALGLKRSMPDTQVRFHYLSSAGGLFEGQKLVRPGSAPTPQRAYGSMKLAQEHGLFSTLEASEISIYRPSSVYGPTARRTKHGLINHLVANTYNRRTTVLDAKVMSLRDYVYSGDIGEYVARRISSSGEPPAGEPIHFLVSGRCASIFEVVARIERIMRIGVRIRFDEFYGNSANITFSNSVIPPGWRPSPLEVGIRQFMLRDKPQTRAIAMQTGSAN